MTRHTSKMLILATALGVCFAHPQNVALAANCNTSDPSCECGDQVEGGGTVSLTADLSCSSGTGLTLLSNTTLDLNGYQLVCTGSCGVGVDIVGTGSAVTGPGVIDGFSTGVDGNGKSGSTVEQLIIRNGSYGVDDAETVENNAIVEMAFDGIRVRNITDLVKGNVVSDCYHGIYIISGIGVRLQENTVVGNRQYGLIVNSTADCNEGSTQTKFNVFAGNATADTRRLADDCEFDLTKNFCLIEAWGAACSTSPILTNWSAFAP